MTHARPFVGISQKSIFKRPCQFLAINAHKMAPRTTQWLQERPWNAPTKGLMWNHCGGGIYVRRETRQRLETTHNPKPQTPNPQRQTPTPKIRGARGSTLGVWCGVEVLKHGKNKWQGPVRPCQHESARGSPAGYDRRRVD